MSFFSLMWNLNLYLLHKIDGGKDEERGELHQSKACEWNRSRNPRFESAYVWITDEWMRIEEVL